MPSPAKQREFDLILTAIAHAQYTAPELNLAGFGLNDQDCLQLMEMLNRNPFLKENLQSLNLSHNHLESFPPHFDFPNLLNLDLQFNQIQSIEGQLRNAPNLQQLLLQQNHLSYIEALPCPNLLHLDLSNNQLESPPDVGSLIQLLQLDLRNNLLVFPPVLSSNPQLQAIHLGGNHIPSELTDLFVAVIQTHQPTTQVLVHPCTRTVYPPISTLEEMRHYCLVWTEHYCQRFIADAMNEEERKKLAQTVACAKKQAVAFPKLLINIKNSIPEQFASSLTQFIVAFHWLLNLSGRVNSIIMASSAAVIEETQGYGLALFNADWDRAWANIVEVADTMNKMAKMKEKFGGAAGFGSKKQLFAGSANPFLMARTPSVMAVRMDGLAQGEPASSMETDAVLEVMPMGSLPAFDQSKPPASLVTFPPTAPPPLYKKSPFS